MKLTFCPINANNSSLDPFLDLIESEWVKIGGNPGLNTFYKNKLRNLDRKTTISEFVIYDNQIVGCYWNLLESSHYGSITFLSNADIIDSITTRAVENGVFHNCQTEVIAPLFKTKYKNSLKQHPIIINERHRMLLKLDTIEPFEITENKFDFFLMNERYAEITGTISYEAHLMSQDYPDYPEMNTLKKRIQLEKNIFKGRSGTFNSTASIMACWNNEVVGFCSIVNVKNFGDHEIVPWIFDISVHPNFMGRKIGKHLLKLSINALIKQKLPLLGLSVTETNFSALRLYETLGFTVYDDFFEFIKPIRTN